MRAPIEHMWTYRVVAEIPNNDNILYTYKKKQSNKRTEILLDNATRTSRRAKKKRTGKNINQNRFN